MSIVLYHCSGARSLRPLWTLEEMGLKYELQMLPFPPRVFQKDFLETNPLGTVPYLIDGSVRMTESAGICQYLVERYGPTPLAVKPEDAEYGAYLNWLFYSDATVTFPQTIVLRYTMLEPEERRLSQAVEDYKRFFLGRLRLLEAALEGREYLCAGRFTIADIAVGYSLTLAHTLGIEEAFTPHIRRWWDAITARDAYTRAVTAQ